MKFSLAFSILIAFALTACGQGGTSRKIASADCTGELCPDSGNSTDGGGDSFAVKVQRTEGIVTHRQLLPNFQSCLGLPSASISAQTRSALAEATSSLSLDGATKDVTAPMLMAVAKVTSELCLDLVNYEKGSSTRTFFPGFTLGGSTTADAAQTFDMKKTLTNLSNACWGRSMTTAEMNLITTKFTAKDKGSAISVCTVVLSSAEAIRF